MLAIKLQRIGKKKQASFRVVVSERRSKLNGRSVEDLGWSNPRTDTFQVKKDRVLHWIGVGAKPTATAHNLLVKARIIEGKKIAVHKKTKEVITENVIVGSVSTPTLETTPENNAETQATAVPAVEAVSEPVKTTKEPSSEAQTA